MRRQGPLTMRHLTVAVLAVVLVNAQLTWWIIYTLRENRTRLELERATLTATARLAAARVALGMEHARDVLESAILAGQAPPENPPPPFQMLVVRDGLSCRAGWVDNSGFLELRIPVPGGCLVASPSPEWLDTLLAPPERFERVAAGSGEIPGAALPDPLFHWAFRPQPSVWEGILSKYRRRIVMVVGEGSFFAVLLLGMMWLLWQTLRREVELERQHQNFLSAITHELKSPLASMKLALETVLRGRAGRDASMRFLANALQDTERLESLVQKVLEVTRYAPGHRSLELRWSDLGALVQASVDTFSRRATAVGAGVTTDIEPGVGAMVDEEAFPIVVSNLLENAVKYGGTPPSVEVTLRLEGHHAVLTVRDNGRGIPEADVPLVFDRFFRSGDEMTRTTQGTGLGLYLVQQIVSAHRGTVRVLETGPKGTTFEVVLPEARRMEEPE